MPSRLIWEAKNPSEKVKITKVWVSVGLKGVLQWLLPFFVLLENCLRGLVGCRGDTFWLSILLGLPCCVFWARLLFKRNFIFDGLETLTHLEIGYNYSIIIAAYLTFAADARADKFV